MDNLGHILKFRDPNNPERWINIPILYQTMYQSYIAYCMEHDIAENVRLSERDYYTTLGTLKDIAEALEEQEGVIPTIPMESGGTGACVGSKSELLVYFGLVDSCEDPSEEKFASTKAVVDFVNNRVVAVQDILQSYVQNYVQTAVAAQSLENLGVSWGDEDPDNDTTPGKIYIKYSDT